MSALDPHDELLVALRALRDADARLGAPPRVEQAILAEWDAAHARLPVVRRAPLREAALRKATLRTSTLRTSTLWRSAAAIAAGVLLTAAMTLLGSRLRTGQTEVPVGDATILLVGEPILRGESARIVRVRMPASALPSLGIRSAAGDLTETVDVDVLVGEDGVARAIKVGM